MRNERTPRTLAECSWVTGYSRASIEQTGRFWERVILVLAVSFVVAVCLKGSDMPEFANTYPAAPHRFDEASVQRYREHEGEIDDEHDAARCYEAEEGRDAEFGPLSCRLMYWAIAIVAIVCAVVIVI